MTKQTYFAVLPMTHVNPVPEGIEEPHGVFDSLAEANEYLRDLEIEWSQVVGGWPFHNNLRINEYATREQAESANISDGTSCGEGIEGVKPLSITGR